MSMFSQFHNDKIKIIKQNSKQSSAEIPAMVDNNKINVHCSDIPDGFDIEDGDFIDRIMPNDKYDRYIVLDNGYKPSFHSFPERFECKVRKRNAIPMQQTQGAITYNLNGVNSRVYNNSTDNSENTFDLSSDDLFLVLKRIVTTQIESNEKLIEIINEMKTNRGKSSFLVS